MNAAGFAPASALDDDLRARITGDLVLDIAALCDELTSAGTTVDTAMAIFIEDFFAALRVKGSQRVVSGMAALPLLAYGAETGDTAPARPSP